MGQLVIKTDEMGFGSAVLVGVQSSEIERIRINHNGNEHPHAMLALDVLDAQRVRIRVGGADPESTVSVSYLGAKNAHLVEDPESQEPSEEPESPEEPETTEEPEPPKPDPEAPKPQTKSATTKSAAAKRSGK